jgi:hypothetical protein
MNRMSAWATAAVAMLTVLTCGCATRSDPSTALASRNPAIHRSAGALGPWPPPLAASLGGRTTWATVPMGAASGPNQFWQLFALSGTDARWSLATPPDVATNGAIILAGQDGRSLVTGIRPSLYLTYSPVSSTRDGGADWTTSPPVLAGLAERPDALAAAPDGRLLALDQNGAADLTMRNGDWVRLASEQSLAASPAARVCQLTSLTGVAFSPAGTPLLGGNCARPGSPGIFSYDRNSWHLARLTLPSSLADQRVTVIRLTRVDTYIIALLQAGKGTAAVLLAAWTRDGRTWQLSTPFELHGASVRSASFGRRGAVAAALSGRHGEILSGPGGTWRSLAVLPLASSVTLALPAPGITEALAASGSMLIVWRERANSTAWTKTQTIHVPIQYGSSS